MQNSDCYGNSQTINFYRAKNVSKTSSVKLHEKIKITEDELADTKKKRISFINALDVFTAFEHSKNGRNLYLSTIDALMNIQNRSDVFYLIDRINTIYIERNQQYIEKYSAAMNVTKYLTSIYESVEKDEEIFVTYENGNLYFFNSNKIAEIQIDFFGVSELFAKNGISACEAGCTINDKSEFKSFIDSFSKNEKRNLDLENRIQNLCNSIKDGEDFTFSIGGGF